MARMLATMNTRLFAVAVVVVVAVLGGSVARANGNERSEMIAEGTFEVQLTPQDDGSSPAGRMMIDKTYRGELVGSGVGQMISKRIDGGSAVYFAIEEVSGSLGGKRGGFTLLHHGRMNADSQSLEVSILEGSGSEDLEGISGSMVISQDESGHRYELKYEL